LHFEKYFLFFFIFLICFTAEMRFGKALDKPQKKLYNCSNKLERCFADEKDSRPHP
jgi:hypothetical protein